MEKINSKEDLINYFKKGCKKENQVSIGVEHEKFLFDKSSNKRNQYRLGRMSIRTWIERKS